MKKSWILETSVGAIKGLRVKYVSVVSESWAEQLPESNWILFAIADAATQLPVEAVVTCLRRNPAGICCSGAYAATLEDCFDIEIAVQTVDRQTDFPGHEHSLAMPVTTSDTTIRAALWYAIKLAPNMCDEVIDTVVCVDFTNNHQAQIRELFTQLATGWLPSDCSE